MMKFILKASVGICQYLLIVFSLLIDVPASAQINTLKGYVKDTNGQPIVAAEVHVVNKNIYTYTNADGAFIIETETESDTAFVIHISAGDYAPLNDTIGVSKMPWVITLNKVEQLADVLIQKQKKSTEIKLFTPIKTEDIGLKELAKAACCNLSESFETTPSVDAGFTDAVSGYKQISMLGLSGPNVAFTRENIPDIRGLASITGLTFTPGPWVQSIQLSKGAGSVVNGFEGVAGQINVELLKPGHEEAVKLLLNAYQSNQGRTEANVVVNHEFSEQLNTTGLFHVKSNWLDVDQNKDGFLDQPKGETYLVGNRWMYLHPKGYEFQLGLKGTYMDLYGGQKSYNRSEKPSNTRPWGFYNTTQRADVWAKIGKIYLDKPNKSMGLQLSASVHDQDAQYGLRNYAAKQQSLYANYIYQNIIGTTDHLIKLGASLQYDVYNEDFISDNYKRKEVIPGVFTEYTYNFLHKFTLVAGLRADFNNLYGAFMTPRLHLRWAPEDNTSIRASIGRAQRTVNVLAEHVGYMASNRNFEFLQPATSKAFGLDPEVAYNMGINATKKFILNYRDGSFSVDYYYTHFQNMVVADIERFNSIRFYNLDGKAYAHSFQAQLDYEVIRNLNTRIAYRYYDVKNDFIENGLLAKPLIANHRFFINAGYETRNEWAFDLTANWTGTKRMVEHIPDFGKPVKAGYNTPSYWIFNGQISKSWKENTWKIYLGAENIFNIMQHHLILSQQSPYTSGFDASLVWGSGMGTNVYLGINYNLR